MPGVPSWLSARPTRGTAFAIHLTLSILVFSSLVAVMLIYWFPGDLFIMDGGWEGLKLVALVDLVLGPLLTLILFKPGKPGLKFDLSVIAAIQIAALGYGFYTTYNQRTVAVVYAEHAFYTVSAKANREADETLKQLDVVPKPVPKAQPFNIPVMLNASDYNLGEYMASVLNGYPAAYERSDQYIPIAGQAERMEKGRKSAADLERVGALERVQSAAEAHNLTLDDVEVYRYRARYAGGFALYNPEQARIIDFVRHRPPIAASDVAEKDS